MITCVTYDNLEYTASAFRAQFQLRHKCFIERQSYSVRSYAYQEYDQYDTPAAVYLVYMDENGLALGCSRLAPAAHHCMLGDLWPEMIDQRSILEENGVWEGTRFCIERGLSPQQRKGVARELVLAYLEFGLYAGVSKIVGVMPRLVLRSVFRESGVTYEALGQPKLIDGIQIQGAAMDISKYQLQKARAITGISHSVLSYPGRSSPLYRAA